MQTTEIYEKNLGEGIDTRNAENQLAPGYWEELINAESSGGVVEKRRGYQQFGGYLPFRVQSIEWDTTDLCFNLDTYVDLSRVRSTPVTVRGTALYDTNAHADFSSTLNTQHYPQFAVSLRNSGTDFTIPQAAHGHTSWLHHSDVYQSTSESNLSNEYIIPNTMFLGYSDIANPNSLTQTDINVSTTDEFIYASLDASVLGPVNYYPNTSGVPRFIDVSMLTPDVPEENTAPGEDQLTTLYTSGNVLTFSFNAADVELQSSNLVISVFEDTGNDSIQKIRPDDIRITGTDVVITLTNPDPTGEYIFLVTALTDDKILSGQVDGTTQTVVIPEATPFTLFSIYTDDNTTRELVIPDTAIFNDVTKELTITFQVDEPVNYQIYYTEASLRVNQLCVEAANANSGSTSLVEMDLYGLDPLEVIEIENRNHWVTHIDTYRSADLNQLISGVAGALYRAELPALNTLYPRLELTVESAQYLTPFFQNTEVSLMGSGRGYVMSTNGFAGPEITDINYTGGFVRFTISAPGLDVSELVGFTEVAGVYTGSLDSDLLTVQNAGYAVMNSSHLIEQMIIDTNTNTIYVDCVVEGVTNTDFDETDVGAYAQIYTSPFEVSSSEVLENTLLPGNTITVGGNTYTVRGNRFDETLLLSGVTTDQEVSSGLFILGSATTDFIPTRTTLDPSVFGYVRGDMIQYTGIKRSMRIKNIIQISNQNVTLLADELTFSTPIATNFDVGQRVGIATEGLEGGVYTVEEVVDTSTLRLNFTFTDTSARFIGQALEIDETLSISDTVANTQAFTPTARWHALEKTATEGLDNRFSIVKYPFDVFLTTAQRIIRSTMTSDNMYLTNGEDALVKYDGINTSRAGLFRWEGGTFVRKVLSTGGAIAYTGGTATGTGDVDSKVFTTNDAAQFTVGQQVTDNLGDPNVVVQVDIANGKVVVRTPFAGAVTSLTEGSILKYYVRLNLIDANNNRIGSAVSGADGSYTIEMVENTTVGIKLAKPPIVDLLDYSRLEYEIYRTRQDGVAFYKLITIPIDYTDGVGYVYFEDTVSDEELDEGDLLSVATTGVELATAIDEPLRAKYITSANNRLVLGSLKDSPRVDVQILRPRTELTAADLDGLTFNFDNGSNNIDYTFSNTSTALTGADVDEGGLFSNLPNPLTFVEGNWYYIGTTKDDANPAGYGWFKAIGGDNLSIVLGPGENIVYTADDFVVEGTTTSIPIWADDETTDGDARYQTGGNQQLIQFKLINALNATQFELQDFALSGEGRTDSSELGRFNIKSLRNTPFNLTVTSTNLFNATSVFINNTVASSGVPIQTKEQNYNSRMLVSFPNFPEVFDRPRAIILEDSLSVIDVNSADGQEITGIIPFFGESTTRDSRKQDIVICFKENSVYAVNVTTRQITKIDSRGVGCNAPNSIAAVPNGIIFASTSGVYRINRSFDVIWIGKNLDRVWKENTNLNQLELATGHVYPREQEYRLSVPVSSDERATEVYVYDYGDEQAGQVGGWSTFNNIPSTGWASDGVNSYFGSSIGKVFRIRDTATDSDYRDDDQPVAWTGTYRALDFGSSKRKLLRAIVSHFRVLKTDSSTTLDIGVDLTTEFKPTSSFTLTESTEDGLSTIVNNKVKSIRQNVPVQKGVYFQLRYSNSTIDTPVALAGISFHVAGLDYTGITQT